MMLLLPATARWHTARRASSVSRTWPQKTTACHDATMMHRTHCAPLVYTLARFGMSGSLRLHICALWQEKNLDAKCHHQHHKASHGKR
jgi:hypothetical protein